MLPGLLCQHSGQHQSLRRPRLFVKRLIEILQGLQQSGDLFNLAVETGFAANRQKKTLGLDTFP